MSVGGFTPYQREKAWTFSALGDRIYEMRCPFVAVGLHALFIVLPHERFHSNGYQKWDIRNDKEMSSFMYLHQHNT